MLKRTFDLIASLLGLTLLSPVLIIVALLVRMKLGSPVLFRQVRPGLNGKPFEMMKFRTMTNEKDVNGNLLPNEERMTQFGSFLRSASLDELPELMNVLKGEMSLVGPRPLLMDYIPYFTKEQIRRQELKPGITGWAQVNGRNAIGWEKKLELDVWYVENRSLWLDLKILYLTVKKVIIRDGITHEGNVSMPRFDDYVQQKDCT
jgi:lipopolysaccharide/colanic/teichoic acid biosynthesis glycosyltransferase